MINVEKFIAAPGDLNVHGEGVKGLSLEEIAGKKKALALPQQSHFFFNTQKVWKLILRLVQKFN